MKMRCKRILEKFGISLAIALLTIFMVTNGTPAKSKQTSQGLAVSLKVLEEKVKERIAKGEYSESIFELCGLKRIFGFVIDEETDDLILIGETDPTSSPLYLDDFVVALRNAWLRYATREGYTYYYSSPGCSIDPRAEYLRNLQQLSIEISHASGPAEVEKLLERWDVTCAKSQDVRVFGIPRNTRFAKVIVDADYYMKRIANGSVSLGISDFSSLSDITMKEAKSALLQGKPISIFLTSRFWFFPGENRFVEDEGIVYIKNSQVKLLTEEEYLTKSGELVGKGKPNPLAKKFADNFTAKYSQIAEKKPLYAKLEALFRFVALARLLKYKDVNFSLNYWLDKYPIETVTVGETLLGISGLKELKHQTSVPGGIQILYLWLPSCGGVAIDIEISRENFTKDKTGELLELKKAVLEPRPSPGALYWIWDYPIKWIVKLRPIYNNSVSLV